jgi:sugar/nucleoside kinase (ribokinase family)
MNASLSRPIGIVGNLNVDQIFATVSRFPKWDEELLVDSSHLELAGTAGYVALAAKALGMNPVVVSTIGDDPNGQFLRDGLAAAGIDDRNVVTVGGASTCIGMIFVGPEGQRGILSVLGAHEQMTVDVAMQVDAEIAPCREVFICGNYLLPHFSPRDVIPYARMCRERGQTVVFDPSWDPAGWTEATRAATFALLETVDLYMPNEEEICHLTATSCWQEAAQIVAPLTREIIIKRGASGAVHIAGDTVTDVPALSIVPVNTIGAGDVFDIGFLYGRRLAWPVAECLRFACAAATHVVAQSGPRTYPDRAAIETFADLEPV